MNLVLVRIYVGLQGDVVPFMSLYRIRVAYRPTLTVLVVHEQVGVRSLLPRLTPNLPTRKCQGDRKGRTYAELVAEGQYTAAGKGKTEAAREIADRLEGKAVQPVVGSDTASTSVAVNIEVARKKLFGDDYAILGVWTNFTGCRAVRRYRSGSDYPAPIRRAAAEKYFCGGWSAGISHFKLRRHGLKGGPTRRRPGVGV